MNRSNMKMLVTFSLVLLLNVPLLANSQSGLLNDPVEGENSSDRRINIGASVFPETLGVVVGLKVVEETRATTWQVEAFDEQENILATGEFNLQAVIPFTDDATNLRRQSVMQAANLISHEERLVIGILHGERSMRIYGKQIKSILTDGTQVNLLLPYDGGHSLNALRGMAESYVNKEREWVERVKADYNATLRDARTIEPLSVNALPRFAAFEKFPTEASFSVVPSVYDVSESALPIVQVQGGEVDPIEQCMSEICWPNYTNSKNAEDSRHTSTQGGIYAAWGVGATSCVGYAAPWAFAGCQLFTLYGLYSALSNEDGRHDAEMTVIDNAFVSCQTVCMACI